MTNRGPVPQPGWYHAEGDPVGTERYWDGSQWQEAPDLATVEHFAAPAPHGSRTIAFFVDAGMAMGLWFAAVIAVLTGFVVPRGIDGPPILFFLVSYVAFLYYNLFYLQGSKGQTIGKKSQNLKLVKDHTGRPVGIGKAIARWFISAIFNFFFCLDLIWILIDGENRTLSDKMLGIRVVSVRHELPTGRLG